MLSLIIKERYVNQNGMTKFNLWKKIRLTQMWLLEGKLNRAIISYLKASLKRATAS